MKRAEVLTGNIAMTAFYHADIYRKFRLSDTQIDTIKLVIKRGSLTSGDLAEAKGLTAQNASTQMATLAKKGYLKRTDDYNMEGSKLQRYELADTWG